MPPQAIVNSLSGKPEQYQASRSDTSPVTSVPARSFQGPTASADGQCTGGYEKGLRPLLATSTSRVIEKTTLDPNQIQHFFNIYVSFYHTAFPVILQASPDHIYEASPLLFWTIIMTAARHDSPDFLLLQVLVPAVKKLLWSTIANPPHTLPGLQAMSILCVWTFPGPSMPIDITFILAGILKSAALHAGLHRPDVLTHYSRMKFALTTAELNEAVHIWCCIYIAVEGVAVGNGQQPYFYADRTIDKASDASNPHELSEMLHQAILLQAFCNKVHLAMFDVDRLEESAAQSTRTSILRALEGDLRELENRLCLSRSRRPSTQFLSSRFQLHAYWLFVEEETPPRREGIIKAFNTAIQLVNEISRGDMDGNPAKYLRFSAVRTCATAAIFMSRIIHSSYRQYVDVDQGTYAFNTALSIFRQCSVEDNDMNGRKTKVLAQIWNIHAELCQTNPQPPSLVLKSRLFFSIAHDALWLWRESYAGQPGNGAPGLPSPLLSPISTKRHLDPASIDRQQVPSPLPAHRVGYSNKNIQRPNTSDDHTDLSASAGHLFSPMDNFTNAVSVGHSMVGPLEPEDTAPNAGYLTPDAMHFDMMFPDPYSDQTWLETMI
ncbi:hypothetical protein H2200_009260 [Cladophialophora chaetospira]|uniref:Transcription factor domain-containing protein n=1 Tax=Cladophialophora chaetospira TaxID=386627 RepID=A0AA38X3S6_9EURO|nr:hypothetical protein H2200_009260 [Cladophialophora chaetospira]